MTSTKLDQVIRDTDVVGVLFPPDELRHNAEIRRTIDAAGRIDQSAAAPLRTPITLDWSTIDGRPKRTPQYGVLALIWVHANTPPTAGNMCVVTFTMEQKGVGATPIGTVSLAAGQSIGEEVYAQPLPAGAYLNPTVTNAGGASGVSVGVVIKAGM